MFTEWLATEHYRLHVIEKWPNGPRKEAVLASARSALESLLRTTPLSASAFRCAICADKQQSATLIEYPLRFQSTQSFNKAA
jgi:hypothetical protein